MKTKKYFRIGYLESNSGVFCISNRENLKYWSGSDENEEGQSDYFLLLEKLEECRNKETYYESIINFTNLLNKNYLIFSDDCSKSLSIYQNSSGLVLLEVVYCDSIESIADEIEFEVMELLGQKSKDLIVPIGDIVIFDSTLNGEEIPISNHTIIKSINNQYFDDVALMNISSRIKEIRYVKYEVLNQILLSGYEFRY